MPKIIAFTGLAGAGKDTSAEFLAKCLLNNNKSIVYMSFASPLKDVCELMFDFKHAQLHTLEGKETIDERWGITPRHALQSVGFNLRQLNKDVFVINMKNRINNVKEDYVLITDLRYDNEAEFIKSMNGTIIHIKRKTDKIDLHESEKGIDPTYVDIVVYNNLDIEHLEQEINKVAFDELVQRLHLSLVKREER